MEEMAQHFPDDLKESQNNRELSSDWQAMMANAVETFRNEANGQADLAGKG